MPTGYCGLLPHSERTQTIIVHDNYSYSVKNINFCSIWSEEDLLAWLQVLRGSIIGASLSEPHANGTSAARVCYMYILYT